MFHISRLGLALHTTYVLLVAATAWAAVYLWRLYCEGFGCTGLGIAWAAWAGFLFAPCMALGGFLFAKSGVRGKLANLTRSLLWFQLALGAGLAAYWAIGHMR